MDRYAALPRMRPPAPPVWSDCLLTVGVTGTNGKTSTTGMVANALGCLQQPVARVTSIGAYVGNEHMNVPRSYAGLVETMRAVLQRGGRYAALELASWSLAQGFMQAWPCQVGVFTNLTPEHMDIHGSMENYLAAKTQLFINLPETGIAVLNGCDPASEIIAAVTPAGTRIIYYGAASRGRPRHALDIIADEVAVSWTGTSLRLSAAAGLGAVPVKLTLRAIGEIYAENALAALAAAIGAGVPAQQAADAIAATAPPPGRFEVLGQSPWIVLDYAHTPDAIRRTLSTARQLSRGCISIVFGAGGDRDRPKRKLMGQAAMAADRVFLTSDNPRNEDPLAIIEDIRLGLQGHRDISVNSDRRQAIIAALEAASGDDVVILAGRGPETHQCVREAWHPMCDADIVREIIGGEPVVHEGWT